MKNDTASAGDGSGLYIVTGGRVFLVDDQVLVDDLTAIAESYGSEGHALGGMTRQELAQELGQAIPADFPQPNVWLGKDGQHRGWLPETLARYRAETTAVLGDEAPGAHMKPEGSDTLPVQTDTSDLENAAAEKANPVAGVPPETESNIDSWPVDSFQWRGVEQSGVDRRIVFAHSQGIVTPSGRVLAAPLQGPEELAVLVVEELAGYWRLPPKPVSGSVLRSQVWITPEALQAIGFTPELAGTVTKKALLTAVGEFFGCEVNFGLSGWFSCKFAGMGTKPAREIELVLMPLMHLDPSPARPMDRGILGIEGSEFFVPEEETALVKTVGERMAWLFSKGGALPSYRWSPVGGHLAEKTLEKARPTPKNGGSAKLVKSPLPEDVGKGGAFPSQWWPDEWTNPNITLDDRDEAIQLGYLDVEIDQQASYPPSAETLYLGYGTPGWTDPDPSVFTLKQPPFGVFELVVPPARDLHTGLNNQLPLPHPNMEWEEPSSFWVTTADVMQLIAPVIDGGAGLSALKLDIRRAWVWPEQHQWLRGFSTGIREALSEAREAGRDDRVEILKAIYTSFYGRMSAVSGDGVWGYPWEKFQQPAWYAAIEAVSRTRALKHAVRIARDHDLYPYHCLRDAWFYYVPKHIKASQLETPLNAKTGKLNNGGYRIKKIGPVQPR